MIMRLSTGHHIPTILLLLLATLLSACYEKEELSTTPIEAEKKAPYVVVTDSLFLSPDEYMEYYAKNNLNPEIAQLYQILNPLYRIVYNTRIPKLEALFQQESQSAGTQDATWGIASYAFHYKSTSAKGGEITLSGRVSFPRYSSPKLNHSLTSLTLFFRPYDITIPSKRERELGLRVLYNSAVIEPDFEGYGISEEQGSCNISHAANAIQMADCIEAALQLMKQHHVTLSPEGYSTSWGISLGAPNLLAFARYYETEATSQFKESVRLHSSAAINGPVRLDKVLEHCNQVDTFSTCLLHTLMNGFEALPAERREGYSLKELVPEWMQTKQLSINLPNEDINMTGSYYELWMKNFGFYAMMFAGDFSFAAWRLSDVLAPDMLDEEGHLKEDSPKVRMLRKILTEQYDWSQWTPQTPLYMAHHPKDGGIPYDQAREQYKLFAQRGGNVFWYDDTLPSTLEGNSFLIHFMTTYMNYLRCVACEYPSELAHTLQAIN